MRSYAYWIQAAEYLQKKPKKPVAINTTVSVPESVTFDTELAFEVK